VKSIAATLLVVSVVVAPAAMAAPRQTPAAEGQIVDFQILPPELTLTAGDSITWTNNGKRPHTVTDRGGLFDTDAILPGAQATVKVDVPGTYEIFCQINPSKMNARLIVQPGTTAPSAVRVQAFDESREGETKRFDPDTLTIARGTRVILANVGGLRHSMVADDGSFAIDIVEPGAEKGRFAGGNASAVIDTPGTHTFYCEIHPAVMRGTLVVTDTTVKAADRSPPVAEKPPATASTSVAEFAFTPTETVVAPGGAVTWTNAGTKPHTATFDDIAIDTGRIEPGASATATAPTQPGSYSYFCSVHNQMRGVLVVLPEPKEVATAPATPAVPAANSRDDTKGTLFAYAIAVLLIGTGLAGLVLGLGIGRRGGGAA